MFRFSSVMLLLSLTSVGSADDALLQPRLQIEGRVAFTEGPAWHPNGNVYFTDIENNRIMRRDPTGALHIFRTPSGRANGLMFDRAGRLHACEGNREGGNRRVTRTNLDGSVTVLTDRYQGKRYNAPNDLTMDRQGRIFFTDPRYGDRSDMELFDDNGKAVEGVYRIDPDGTVTRVLTHEIDRPNGIAIDDEYLFVADNMNSGLNDGVGGNRKLWRFNVTGTGEIDPQSRKLLFDWGTDRGPDGMAMDAKGNLYVTAGFNFANPPAETNKKHKAGVYIISREGKQLGFIPIPADMITNCTFGGPDYKTLFITAGHKLWSIPVNTPGLPPAK